MNNIENNIEKLIELTQGIEENILVFRVNKITLANEAVYINPTCRRVLQGYFNEGKDKIKLEDILGVSENALKVFVLDKLEGKNLVEDRMIYLSKEKSDIFSVRYNVFNRLDEILLQVVFEKNQSSEYLNELNKLENKLENIIFNEGYLTIVSLKNHDLICKSFGNEAREKVIQIIEDEVEKMFGDKSYIDKMFKTLFFTIEKKIENPVSTVNELIANIHKAILDVGINVISDVRFGISSFSDNIYKAFREATYSLHEILNTTEIINYYAELKDQQMLEYIIKNDLPKAISNDELSIFFQGIFDSETSQLFGFEVLLRWRHSKLGNISPADFIPIAEELDLVTELDLWVLENALKEFEKVDFFKKETLKLNFNISPQDLIKMEFINESINIIENSSIPFTNIIFEITETLNLSPERSGIRKLKSKGILVALDDFGTGFSSLSQIKYYEIDYLKIDISFIRDINKNYDNTLITNAILALAKSLKIKVIAEGVEENEQVEFLRNKKCDYLQGYKLHRPSSIKDATRELASDNYEKFIKINNRMPYKDYVGYYQYGKLIYISVDYDGEIRDVSGLLSKTLEYEIRVGELIETIIINSYVNLFKGHMETVKSTGRNKSFMTELIGLKESIPVKVTIIADSELNRLDIFLEDYRDKRDLYLRTRNIYNRYDLIFSNINTSIIVTDSNMIIHEWNKKAEEVFGYMREEAIGENLIKLLVNEKLEDLVSSIAHKTLLGEVTENINENIRKDGEIIVCRWKNTLLPNDSGEIVGFISWIEDITEKLRIEEEINTLSTVIKQKPNPVIITNIEAEIEYVNNAFTELTGYTFEEVIGENPNILSSGYQSREYYKRFWDTIESGNVWEGEFKNKKKNGEIYITESRVFPIKNEKGITIKYCCIQRDITREVEKDNVIREINSTLESQERLSMVGQMAAGIIHEINNPLSYIDMNVEAMLSYIKSISEGKGVNEAVNELYELHDDLKEGLDSIKEISSGLKKFAYKGRTENFDMVNLNDEIKTISIVSKNEYKYFCEMEIIEGEIDDIYGDSGKIKQVLLNLILNAVYAIREKGDGWGKITIRTYEEDNYICCDIEDNGNGIPEDIQKMIFESFFTTKAEGVGTGLGLSLSKKIIEVDHKGKLSFKSVPNEGTIFSIKFNKGIIVT